MTTRATVTKRPGLTTIAFAMALSAAAFAPLIANSRDRAGAEGDAFPGWPSHYGDSALSPLPLSERETLFLRDFPGRVARFEDGRREIIVRWVNAPTRRLHPAADCFRGIGYAITPQPVSRTKAGQAMSCFRAVRGGEALSVCEIIESANGESWPDVSSWYWSALLGASPAPWWSYVIAERG